MATYMLMELRTYVKEGATIQACAQAKKWKEYWLENKLVIYIDNMYSHNPIPLHYVTIPTLSMFNIIL